MTKALVQRLDPDGEPFGAAVAVIASRLTVDVLRPSLESQGMTADEAAKYEVGFDCTPLAASMPTWDLTVELATTAKRTKALMRVILGREYVAIARHYEKHRALVARSQGKPRRYRHGRVGVFR